VTKNLEILFSTIEEDTNVVDLKLVPLKCKVIYFIGTNESLIKRRIAEYP
jgi:hypothetical protein